jgi:Kef-type K+ transport system membrane component KefB
VSDVLLPLAIVLIAAEIGAALAHALGQPRVVGQIGAGIALGPSVFGVVSDGPQVAMLAGVGALAILATAGLETNVEAMRRVGRPAFLAAFGGVLVPLVAGTAVALMFGLELRASLFCGAILTATSVGITAATLQSLGLLGGRAGLTILGAAVLDDVLGLMVLAVVVAETSSGSSPIAVMIPMIATISIAALAIRYLPAHLHRVVGQLHIRGGGLAAMLGFILLVAWLFERFGGLAGITGAYIAGLALAGSPLADRLKDGLLRGGEGLVVPVFFASIGLAADLRTVPPVLPFAIALLAVAVAGKLVGSGLGARLGGLDGRDSTLVGIGMIGRGEVALVAATLGLRSGAIDAGVYAAVVLLTVATTLIAPIGMALWQRAVTVPAPTIGFGRAIPVRIPVTASDER